MKVVEQTPTQLIIQSQRNESYTGKLLIAPLLGTTWCLGVVAYALLQTEQSSLEIVIEVTVGISAVALMLFWTFLLFEAGHKVERYIFDKVNDQLVLTAVSNFRHFPSEYICKFSDTTNAILKQGVEGLKNPPLLPQSTFWECLIIIRDRGDFLLERGAVSTYSSSQEKHQFEERKQNTQGAIERICDFLNLPVA